MLGAREFILATVMVVGVAYCQTRNESHLVSGHGTMHDRTLVGEIRPIFDENRSIIHVAHKP